MDDSIIALTITGADSSKVEYARQMLVNTHAVGGLSYSTEKTRYWMGGQMVERDCTVLRAITYQSKLPDVNAELPKGVSIVSAYPCTYVSAEVAKWLRESVKAQ